MKICICDLDGVVANSTARFAKAEEAKRVFIASSLDWDASRLEREATSLYWQTAFTPELVALDMLIEGTDAAIEVLEKDYSVVYLTSRPESLRQATREWLVNVRLDGPKLVMKSPAFQYTKTTVWKAGMVQTLAALYGATEIVFIDDEEANCDALRQATDNEGLTHLWCYNSLQESVEDIAEG